STPGTTPRGEAPTLSKLALRVSSARVARSGRSRDLVISWSDPRAAKTTIAVQRAVRRHGRGKKTRTAWSTLKGSLSHSDRAGANSLRWNGTLDGRRLRPGS